MRLSFHSIDDEENKIFYEANYERSDNEIMFVDKVLENTVNHIIFDEDKLKLIRTGDTQSEIIFDISRQTPGFYKNSIGLEFEFIIKTNKIKIENNKILVEYNMILDEFTATTHKIWILLH